jgi:hypothetical protein
MTMKRMTAAAIGRLRSERKERADEIGISSCGLVEGFSFMPLIKKISADLCGKKKLLAHVCHRSKLLCPLCHSVHVCK